MTAYVTRQLCFINVDSNTQISMYVTLENREGELDLRHFIENFDALASLEVERSYFLDPRGIRQLVMPYILPREFFENQPLILYHKDSIRVLSRFQEETDQETHKERNKERSIKEVIASIKKWRSLHKTKINGVRVSLQQAAELVGVSKKSLDDYFCQLRLGEKYGFDFYANLHEGIGALRLFVKKHRPKHERSNGNEKHPKTLRIIQEFPSEPDSDGSPAGVPRPSKEVAAATENSLISETQSEVDQSLPFSEAPEENLTAMGRIQEEELENQFFKLDLILDEPTDPFVPFLARDYRDFSRKEASFDFESEGIAHDAENFMW